MFYADWHMKYMSKLSDEEINMQLLGETTFLLITSVVELHRILVRNYTAKIKVFQALKLQ